MSFPQYMQNRAYGGFSPHLEQSRSSMIPQRMQKRASSLLCSKRQFSFGQTALALTSPDSFFAIGASFRVHAPGRVGVRLKHGCLAVGHITPPPRRRMSPREKCDSSATPGPVKSSPGPRP